MPTARDLRTATTRELREQIVHGHPVDAAALEGWVYRGTALGLPSFVERFTWKTFEKTFYRDPRSGRLMGWNVRLEQDGIDAPSRPKLRDGEPVTEWYYEVTGPAGVPMPDGFDRGLIIDYSHGDNPPGPMHFIKDPLVALSPDSADELLGVSYLVVGNRCLETPTYFTLEREHPVDYIPPRARPRQPSSLWLSAVERGWAEELFSTLIGTGGEEGLPAFSSVDRSGFWSAFQGAATPLVRAGLRPMLHTLTFLPLLSGYGRPFFRLSPADRERFVVEVAASRRYFVRQSVTTLKMLACFAYFDDPTVRARYDVGAP